MFADEALPDAHSPKQSTAAAQEGILHNRGERALVRSASKGEVEPLNAFDKTRPLDDIEVIRKRSCTRRTSDVHASLILGTTLDYVHHIRELRLRIAIAKRERRPLSTPDFPFM